MEPLIADGMTAWDFLSQNWGTIGATLSAVGLFIVSCTGAITYGIRTVWAWVADNGSALIKDHRDLLNTLKTESPKHTDTLRILADGSKDSKERGEMILEAAREIKTAVDDVAAAVVAGACPERKEVAEAHLKAHIERVSRRQEEMQKRKP